MNRHAANRRTVARLAVWASLLLLLGAFLWPAPPADADVVRLRTGVSLKGQARNDLSDTDKLVFEDIVTGALRSFVWAVVDPADRDRLWIEWGWQDASRRLIDGHHIRRRQATGEIVDIFGLVLDKTGDTVRIKRGGEEIDIPASDVVEILDEQVDPRDVFTPQELYERALKQLGKTASDPLTTEEHWLLAQNADWCELLEKAREHFAACAADTNFLRSNIAKQRLERVEALLRDQAALAQLREIRTRISLKAFRRAKELLAKFEAEQTEASEPVKRRLEKAKKFLEESRNRYFQREARSRFFKEVKNLISKKVREKDITYSDTFGYTRRELEAEAFESLAAYLNKRDDITVAQAKEFWDARPKKLWWTASLGGGTFIARPPKMKKINKKRGKSKKKSGQPSGPAPKTPPKPTRDSWWAKAKSSDRMQHMLARFAQESGLFEVSEQEQQTVCPTCNGRGAEQKTLSNGQLWTYTCTRCAGAAYDIKIRFR